MGARITCTITETGLGDVCKTRFDSTGGEL